MNCIKCGSLMTIMLRKKDTYCDECFITSTNHKFRACLGKNKVLSPNENVMVCLSGGSGSLVLLDLIHYGISLDNNKKLRINPYFLHLLEDRVKDTEKIVLNQCKKYNFAVYITHISDYMKENIQLPQPDSVIHIDKNMSKKFYEMLDSMPATAANDYLTKVKRSLYLTYAKEFGCKIIFTAESTNTLAVNLLSNIVIGRGSQVESDVGFCDTRNETIKILRPMRDISKEELYYYIKMKQINPVCESNKQNHSLQNVIKLFVEDLQENFQSTISTVYKTADKLGNCEKSEMCNKCTICGSIIDMKNYKLSALEATNFSRTVSLNNQKCNEHGSLKCDDNTKPMFPLIYKYLCYACSRNYSEIDQNKLPEHIQSLYND